MARPLPQSPKDLERFLDENEGLDVKDLVPLPHPYEDWEDEPIPALTGDQRARLEVGGGREDASRAGLRPGPGAALRDGAETTLATNVRAQAPHLRRRDVGDEREPVRFPRATRRLAVPRHVVDARLRLRRVAGVERVVELEERAA